MEVHIGSLIKERSRELRIGPTELGAKIDTSKQNVYGIFKRKSVDTDLLAQVSKALDFDFFKYYSNVMNGGGNHVVDSASTTRECNEEVLKQELEIVKKENEYLKKINFLLDEKLSLMIQT